MTSHPLQQISFIQTPQAYVVEASAGTGKTWTIERLYVKALLEANQITNDGITDLPIGVENILVVTFTNDATDELKQRISEQIQASINILIYLLNDGRELDSKDLFIDYLKSREYTEIRKDITLLTRALQNFDQAAIFTIHGFCNRILNDYKFDCKIDVDFELIPSKKPIIEELVRNFLRIYVFNNKTLANHLEATEHNLNKMFSSLDDDLDLVQKITNKIPNDAFIIRNGEYTPKYELNFAAKWQDGISNPDLYNDKSKNKITNKELQREIKAALLVDLIEYIQRYYALESHKTNAVSYDELIQLVADSVKTSPTLADSLFYKYPVAFIDEFQDTDALQWNMFSRIYKLKENKARGSIVVVGDPKQAIYRFRGADVETYITAKNEIDNCLVLDDNYRSNGQIMDFVNNLFSLENQNSTLADSFLGNEIDYTLVNARGAAGIELPSASLMNKLTLDKTGTHHVFYDEPVQIVAIDGKGGDEKESNLLNAMALEILNLLNLDSSLKGKIAVLVSRNSEATKLVEFFRKYGIKAVELKLGNIFATQTARDLCTILESCQDLGNRKKFNQALSVQLFNQPLEKLADIHPEYASFIEKWYRKFFDYKNIWLKDGVLSLVYRLIEDIANEYNHTEIKAFSHRELANIFQLAELINKHAKSQHNISELMYWFKNKIKQAGEQLTGDLDGSNEELVRLDNDDEQIVITTQHKSKGLEYEVLFCPFFKSRIKLDGEYDFNHKRPFFASYTDNHNQKQEQMIMDTELGQRLVHTDNKEISRLNYVALTRAKSRIYIYLTAVTKSQNKYHASVRPSKVYDLFGFNIDNNSDDSHSLFNYPLFFSEHPQAAIKKPDQMRGVVAYSRKNIDNNILQKLSIVETQQRILNELLYVHEGKNFATSYYRQSYSALASHSIDDKTGDWFDNDDHLVELSHPEYRYKILRDSDLKGATFGTLFHALCEEYPFSSEQLSSVLVKQKIVLNESKYLTELTDMIDFAFNYPLFTDGTSLNKIPYKQHEMEFNLNITNSIDVAKNISPLLAKYWGQEHPFTVASKLLGTIEKGFLNGFIDLFFLYDGKYWVLDYKTNTLSDYSHATIDNHELGQLVDSMSDHHYYLQYLLYLVAIKRYLEDRLGVDDATDLIGGAVYFYVRGAFIVDGIDLSGVFIDSQCGELIRELDMVLRGLGDE